MLCLFMCFVFNFQPTAKGTAMDAWLTFTKTWMLHLFKKLNHSVIGILRIISLAGGQLLKSANHE